LRVRQESSKNVGKLAVERPVNNKSMGKNKLMQKLMNVYLDDDKEAIQKSVCEHLEYSLAKTRFNIDVESCYRALSYSIRDRLIEHWNDTQQQITQANPKRAYYLSIEYLLGRALQNAL